VQFNLDPGEVLSTNVMSSLSSSTILVIKARSQTAFNTLSYMSPGRMCVLFYFRSDDYLSPASSCNRGVCSLFLAVPCPFALCPSAALAAFLSRQMNHRLIANKHPCNSPVNMNKPHALQPPGPSLTARLAAKTKLPGVCMHIIGTDKLPVSCSLHVIMICGTYCIAASAVASRPRKLAQPRTWDGAA
jgi:hypothetical protein